MRKLIRSLAVIGSAMVLVVAAHSDEKRPLNRPATFPCKFGLEGKYQAFQEKLPAVEVIQALLQEDAEGQNLVPWDEGRYTSVWSAVHRRLKSEPDVAKALAKLPEEEVRGLLEAAKRSGDSARFYSILRRYSFSSAVQEALIELGEQELRRGNAGLALRCFQDAQVRSTDASLRAKAQVGCWLTLAQEDPNEDALADAFQGIDPKAEYPWMGGKLKASTIRERLTVSKKAAVTAPRLAELERTTLQAPLSPTWINEQPTVHDNGVIVAGPNLLASFGNDSTKPRWSATSPTAISTSLFAPLAPGPFQPAVAHGRIYTRWGIEPNPARLKQRDKHHQLVNVSAFDLRSGDMLWSTRNESAWDDLAPVSDPTYAEGRVYVLAINRKLEYCPISLVCLEAESGSVLWKREIASACLTLAPPTSRLLKLFYREMDVAHFGNAVTVVRGAVYCQTNMGLVARCDARDGMVEWVRTYPRDPGTAPFMTLVRRQGSAPLVSGKRVILLPRDALTVLALESETGELVWKKDENSSYTIVGTAGNQMFLADGRGVTALEMDSGKEAWDRRFETSIEAKVSLVDRTIYAGTPSHLYRLSAATGEVQEEQAWDPPETMLGTVVRGKLLFILIK